MKKVLAIILCGILFLFLPLTSGSKPADMSASAVEDLKRLSDISIDLKLQQQQLEFFKVRLDQQDKRIGDLALYLACFGVLLTVIVVYFSFRSTREAVLAAKDEARKEAEKQSKEFVGAWIADEGQQLLIKKVDGALAPEINKALVEIRAAADSVLGELEVELRNTHDNNLQQQRLLEELKVHKLESNNPLSQIQLDVVEKVGKELENIPPQKYQFNDWFALAVGAFTSKKYEVAAEYFARAAEADSDPINQIIGHGHQAAMLSKLARYDEAIVVLEGLVKRFIDSQKAEVRQHIGMVLSDIGFALLCKAKIALKNSDEKGGNELLKQSQMKINSSFQFNPEHSLAIGNLGYVLFLLGKEEEARTYLAKAISLGGEEIRALELSDAEISPLHRDEAFKALVKSL